MQTFNHFRFSSFQNFLDYIMLSSISFIDFTLFQWKNIHQQKYAYKLWKMIEYLTLLTHFQRSPEILFFPLKSIATLEHKTSSSSPALSRFMNIEAGLFHVVFYDLFYDVSRQQYSVLWLLASPYLYLVKAIQASMYQNVVNK